MATVAGEGLVDECGLVRTAVRYALANFPRPAPDETPRGDGMSDEEIGGYRPFERQSCPEDLRMILLPGHAPTMNDRQGARLAPEVEIGSDRRLVEETNWAAFSSTELHAMAYAENEPGPRTSSAAPGPSWATGSAR